MTECYEMKAKFLVGDGCEANLRVAVELAERIAHYHGVFGVRHLQLDRLILCGGCRHGRRVIRAVTGLNVDRVIKTMIASIRAQWERIDNMDFEDIPQKTSTERYYRWLEKNKEHRKLYLRQWALNRKSSTSPSLQPQPTASAH